MNNNDLELAKFKLQSGEFDEAKPILERLAVNENSPDAWAYLGILRLNQVETGKFTAQQALECFDKCVNLAPNSRQELQMTFSSIALSKAQLYYSVYFDNRKKLRLSWLKMFGNALVVIISAILGANSKNRFGSIAGAGGAAAGGVGIGRNLSTRSQSKQMMALCSNYLNDLTVCIEQFCSSDNQSYRHFIDGLTTTKQKSMTNHFNKKLLPILTTEHNQKLLTIKTK
jgi:tetratricopeptide (TPR) repeat protein